VTQKKILLAVDDSIYSKYAIIYAAKMSALVKEMSFTLFHVLPTVSLYLMEEAKTSVKAQAELKKVVRKNEEKAHRFMNNYREQMIGLGVNEDHIEVVTQPKMLGMARDILERAQKSLYDTIVIGRRGLSRIHEAFSVSVSKKLLQHSQLIPVWVIDKEVTSQKIMIAIDGSESSLRAVDHLCFMLMGNPEITVTLFHVAAKIGDYCEIDFNNSQKDIEKLMIEGDRRCVRDFYIHARQKFQGAGISDDRIHIKEVSPRMNVGKAILKEFNAGGYGTLVIGRRGIGRSFFMGSVSEYLVDKIENCALWLVS
jgi:nucleotide-binding universal stress UspA family protein